MSGARDGFTLLEILIAISLTALLSFTAFQIFQQIHRSIEAAKPERNRDHTARIFLDRFARELVGATLVVKPEETDRAQFPWLFLAEDRLAEGRDNDAIRFITQTPVRAPGRRSPGLRQVTYAVASAGDRDHLALYRQEERLGRLLERELRIDEAEPVLEDVATFSLIFEAEGIGSLQSWDSTSEALLDALPTSVEVGLQLWERGPDGESVPGREHTRHVALPVRPFAPAEEEPEDGAGCEDGPTVEECLEQYERDIADHPQGNFVLRHLVAAGNGCWNSEDPSEELSTLHESFTTVLGIPALEACLP